jgi:hypothetical protein
MQLVADVHGVRTASLQSDLSSSGWPCRLFETGFTVDSIQAVLFLLSGV